MQGIHRKKSHRKTAIVITGLAIVAVGSGLTSYFMSTSPEKADVVTTSPAVETERASPPSSVVQAPARMVIEKIGVAAAVHPVGLTEDGAMDAPKNDKDIGWYEKSAKMGEKKLSILLDGHYGTHSAPAVFYRLSELAADDVIDLYGHDGSKKTFVVTAIEVLPLEKVDMAKALYPSRPETETLTIITCDGRYDSGRQTYDDRTVLYATLRS